VPLRILGPRATTCSTLVMLLMTWGRAAQSHLQCRHIAGYAVAVLLAADLTMVAGLALGPCPGQSLYLPLDRHTRRLLT
jgi:hypothetical protein